MTLRDAISSLPKFSGKDPTRSVEAWAEAIQRRIVIYGWTPLEGFLAGSSTLEGPAKKWLEGRLEISTWGELRRGLQEEFEKMTSPAKLHGVMANRRRRRDESVVDFVQDMKALGRQGGISERDVVAYIIQGVTTDENVRLSLKSARNFADLSDRLDDAEDLLTRPRDGNSADKGKTIMSKPVHKDLDKNKCFNCGEEGHRGSACPKRSKGTKCYRCGLFGHISKN